MNIIEENEDDLPPLDPATERVRKKMVRLLAVSISVMLIGLMAVLGAIVYKVTDTPPDMATAASEPAREWIQDSRLRLPPAAEIVSVALDGPHVLLHIRQNSVQSLVIFDLTTGKALARVALD